MPIDPTTSIAPTTTDTSTGLGALGPDGFLQLLVAQLRYQDPMAPSDPNAMLQQTSMLAQVQTLQEVAANQQRLLGLQQTAMSADLIGHSVTGHDANGLEVTGTVDAVRFEDTGPVLVVGDREIALAAALELRPATTA